MTELDEQLENMGEMLQEAQSTGIQSAGAYEEIRKSVAELQAELRGLADEVRRGFAAYEADGDSGTPKRTPRSARVAPAPDDSGGFEQRGRPMGGARGANGGTGTPQT
jgi:hypothetical protein